jgi:hypothetical protein
MERKALRRGGVELMEVLIRAHWSIYLLARWWLAYLQSRPIAHLPSCPAARMIIHMGLLLKALLNRYHSLGVLPEPVLDDGTRCA